MLETLFKWLLIMLTILVVGLIISLSVSLNQNDNSEFKYGKKFPEPCCPKTCEDSMTCKGYCCDGKSYHECKSKCCNP